MANKFPIDLKKFKHISSDDQCTVLEHADGHQLKVAHKALSKKFREQLEALKPQPKAHGGEIKKPKGYAGGGFVPEIEPGIPTAEDPFQKEKELQAAAKDAYNQQIAGSGYVFSDQDLFSPEGKLPPSGEIDEQKFAKAEQTVANAQDIQAQEQARAAESGIAPPQSAESKARAAEFEQWQADYDKTARQNALRAKFNEPPLPLPPQPGTADRGIASVPEADSAAPPPSSMAEQPAATPPATPAKPVKSELELAQDAQMRAIDMQTKALKDQADAQAKAIEATRLARQEAEVNYKNELAKLDQEGESIKQDIKDGYISPDKFWTGYKGPNGEQIGGHSKVAAAIGMLLAGFNVSDKPNAVVQMLEKQIDQSLDAQKANLASKENLLAANLRRYGDIGRARDMTRIQLNEALQSEIDLAAAKSANPMAQAKALEAKSLLQQQLAQQKQIFAQDTMVSEMLKDPAKIGMATEILEKRDPKRAADIREREVPGLGLARTKEQASELQKMKGSLDASKDALRDLVALSKKAGSSLSLEDRAKANTIRSAIMGVLREPILGPGTVNDREREKLEALVADPTAIFSMDSVTKARFQALGDQLDKTFMAQARARGVNPPASQMRPIQVSAPHDAAKQWAMQNPNDPRAKAILKLQGK